MKPMEPYVRMSIIKINVFDNRSRHRRQNIYEEFRYRQPLREMKNS